MKKLTKEGFAEFCKYHPTNGITFTSGKIPSLAEEYAATLKDEPMSVDQIEPILRKEFDSRFIHELTLPWQQLLYRMAKSIQPLTVQQGFVPDWESAPEWATSLVMVWSRQHQPWGTGNTEFKRIPRPVTEKTDNELRESAIEALRVNENDRESLLKICEILGRKVTK